ncbi:MAG: histidinol-phosphate transaminase [bacterium]|nr:histidinol-phosphate transaminase [Deltaproteobacteria bacterium]MCP4908991.1 histidinol-phosphate transaminase [bacterium]
MADLVKPHIRDLDPYVPGKPMEELERELGISNSIKLASNENPLGPSPKAVEAMRAAAGEVHRYPDGASFALRTKLSDRLGVAENQLVFGTGGDEILELIAKTLIGPGDEVVYAWPSFAMYPIVVKGMGAEGVQVPLTDDFVHDLDAMAAAVTPKTRVVMICNPNNPSGTSVGADAFDRFVSELSDDIVLVVDEAYFEFARRDDLPDVIAWMERRPGTLALRTFSKIYGLAGIRIGYGICDSELASYLERARHPFNVNRLAEVAAVAALDDEEHVRRTIEMNSTGIDYLRSELEKLGIESWPSEANFILARTGSEVFDALLARGIIVRPMKGFGLTEHVRISVGLPEDNERLIKALGEIRGMDAAKREAGP